MTDPFIAAILADPDNDAPRLIYADWLDEQGECERAEFIRVQVELAGRDQPCTCGYQRLPCNCKACQARLSPETEALRRREWELLSEAELQDWMRFPFLHNHITWRRGFVHSLSLIAADWLSHADTLLASQPIQEVTLTTWPAFRTEGRAVPMDRDAVLEETHERWPQIKHWHLPDPVGSMPRGRERAVAAVARWIRENSLSGHP